MNSSAHARFRLVSTACGAFVFSVLPAVLAAQESTSTLPSGMDLLPLLLSAVAVIFGAVALFFSVRASNQSGAALQESAEARARTQASAQALSAESLAATERVWATRISALEAQVQNSAGRGGGRAPSSQDRQASADFATRFEELEKTVNGLSVSIAQNRRGGAAGAPGTAAGPGAPTTPELPWPTLLKTEKQGIKELRDLLQEGAKTTHTELESFFQRLNAAETWSPTRRPSMEEMLSFLQEVSQSFHTVLRKGASQPAHEGSRMADRLLGLLRPVWQKYYPALDCRIFYPGTPFDPEWMEDQNPSGTRRPTISEMFSWAIHEKQASGRRVIAKSRVTTE